VRALHIHWSVLTNLLEDNAFIFHKKSTTSIARQEMTFQLLDSSGTIDAWWVRDIASL
jgi:hypothetical protein